MKILIKILSIILILSRLGFSQNSDSSLKTKIIYTGYARNLFNDVDIRDAEVAIQLWSDQLVENFDNKYSSITKIYQSNNNLIDAYQENKLDIIILLTMDYFDLENKIALTPLICATEAEKKGYNICLVVRKDSNIKSITDLKNKNVILPPINYAPLSEAWLKSLFLKKGLKNYSSFFSKIFKAEKNSQPVLSVFFKNNDACVVPYFMLKVMEDLNPQIKNELNIIEESPPLINGIICIRKDMDEESKSSFMKFIMNLPKTANGKLIFSLFGIMELKKIDPAVFENTKNIYQQAKLVGK